LTSKDQGLIDNEVMNQTKEYKTVLFPVDSTVKLTIKGLSEPIKALVDSGSTITLIKSSLLPKECVIEQYKNVTLRSAFNDVITTPYCEISCKLLMDEQDILKGGVFDKKNCGVTDEISDDVILSLKDYETLLEVNEIFMPKVVMISNTGLLVESEGEASKTESSGKCLTDEQCDLISLNKNILNSKVQIVNVEEEDTDLVIHSEYSREELMKMQNEDDSLKVCFKDVGKANAIFSIDSKTNLLFRKATIAGRKVNQLVIPDKCKEIVFAKAHTRFHLGINKTLRRMNTNFYFPGMTKFCESKVNGCVQCQLLRRSTKAERIPMERVERPSRSLLSFSCDVIGPIPVTSSEGHKYILTFVETFSKYPVLFPLKSLTTRETVQCILQLFCMFGIVNLYVDRGTNFTSALNYEICKKFGVNIRHGPVLHSQSYGLIERLNGTVNKLLKVVLQGPNPEQWNKYLQYLMLVMRSTFNATTNVSPHELLFGHEPVDALQLLKDNWCENKPEKLDPKTDYGKFLGDLKEKLRVVAEFAGKNVDKVQEKYIKHYNKDTHAKSFDPNDEVLVLIPSATNKLLSHWVTAKIVSAVTSSSFNVIFDDGSIKIIHCDNMRRFNNPVKNIAVVYEADDEMGNIVESPDCRLRMTIQGN